MIVLFLNFLWKDFFYTWKKAFYFDGLIFVSFIFL